MAEIDDRIEQRLNYHKDEMLREIGKMVQISTATSANGLSKLSKLVTKELPKFKRKSNEEQYKINHKVMLKLDEVQDSSDANECKSLAKEGINPFVFCSGLRPVIVSKKLSAHRLSINLHSKGIFVTLNLGRLTPLCCV